MSGTPHRYELIRVSEDEMNQLRSKNGEIAGLHQYYCVTRHNTIIVWPRADAQKRMWHLSFEAET